MKLKDNLRPRNFQLETEADFDMLFQSYYHDLVTYAHTFLHDMDEAEDLVQNLFIHFWENARNIKLNGSLEAYFFKSVKNRCLNKLKSMHVYDKHKVLYLEATLSMNKSEDVEDATFLEKELLEALEKLPDQVREIIELKYLKGKKVSEIACQLELSVNTVKTQLHRGKSKLRKEMDPGLFSLFFLI
ncbi:RNA polymerase sigma-70 factor [Echinicola strongylocentroti]|uniref:RNA polymerase sigma-70 factor n=1 Tax=Echinicola strongylocentroti TaxID=1795355 RepID=UPI0013A6992C|nr:RNA polymerase sigma-70 factor [Echinicola strongylocentroti]